MIALCTDECEGRFLLAGYCKRGDVLGKKYWFAALAVLGLAVITVGVLRLGIRRPGVRFSHKEAFQEEAFALTLDSGFLGGEIYYTLDGSTPTLESEVYQGPLWIGEGLPERATVVRAAVRDGKELGKVYTQTYFVGEDVSRLFDVMVVSLSADEEHLYDEKTGIFANYDESGENGEWDRPAYVEFYEADGSRMFSQGTGIAVSGHGSRKYEQKSIKMISSTLYDEEHATFDYDFFESDMGGNRTGQSYNRLVLRNGGSDHKGSMIRWNVVSRLGKEAGIVCAGARPGVLFLNGTYYGLIQLQEKYTRYNTAQALGAQKDDIEKFEPNEINSARFGGYYNPLHQDLNDPERRQKLEECVDTSDMLRHYAVNLIMNNVDWPYHNFLSWKCAKSSSSLYGDGRVRFFLYDLDAVYQDTEGMEIPNTFDYLMEEPLEDSTDTLYLMMQSDVYRTQFVNLICDLTATVYEEGHVLQVIEEEDQKIAHTMEVYYTPDQRERQQAAVEEMKRVVNGNNAQVHERLKSHLGAADPYTLTVKSSEGVTIAFSQIRMEGEELYTGTYYHNYPLSLVALPPDGQRCMGWLVNGEQVMSEELLLDESYTAAQLTVEPIIE